MSKYVVLVIAAIIIVCVAILWTNRSKVVISLPRHNDDPAIGYIDSLGFSILFDTGAGMTSIPENVLQICKNKGLKTEKKEIDKRIRYIDNTVKHYDTAYSIEFPFIKGPKKQLDCILISSSSYPYPHIVVGRNLLNDYVLCYYPDRIELSTVCPKDYDVIIPIHFNKSEPFVNLKVNGIDYEFFLDTGMRGGIEMPLSDTIHAVSELTPFEEPVYFGGDDKTDHGFTERRGEVEMGSVVRHPEIVYTDMNNKPYYFSPAYLPPHKSPALYPTVK